MKTIGRSARGGVEHAPGGGDDGVEVGAERRRGVGEGVDEVDHEYGGPPAEAGGATEAAPA